MGSIPPAASIEFPQREIANLITNAGITPSNADLVQLAKGVQSNRLNYALDTGAAANVYVIAVNPGLTAYAVGQRWNVKISHGNTGPSTININGLGARNIVLPSGRVLGGGEMPTGAVVGLVDDGTNLQIQNMNLNALSAPLNYYVNATTGNDTAYDGLTPTISGGHGPFATIQRAITATTSWNMNGYNVTIYVADGSYSPFSCAPLNGSGFCTIIGNQTTPANVLVHATTGEAIIAGSDNYEFRGMKVQSDATGTPGHYGNGIRAYSSRIGIQYMEFGACADSHLQIDGGATCSMHGPDNGNPGSFHRISGSSPVHMLIGANAYFWVGHPNMTIVGAVNIGVWCQCSFNSTFVGAYGTLTGSAFVTGQKYTANMNGVIAVGGLGANYFPGTSAGTTSTGGQYQ
jgi:hypothetical protein